MLFLNSFGTLFKVSIIGSSHGPMVGVLIDGVKPGLKMTKDLFSDQLARRKPGAYGTPRKEDDEPVFLSGVFNDYTTGAPLLISFENNNQKPKDYETLKSIYRPSHSDYVANLKYHGFNDYRGGGTFSGRLTLGLVAAGVVADSIYKFDISSEIESLNGVMDKTLFKDILEKAKIEGDSVGGVVKITVKNMKKALGEPYFDSVESVLSHLLFSVGAVKGVSFGAGFSGTKMLGSAYNDLFINKDGKTLTNHDGGIQGGITNGNDLVINVAVKPTPSIKKSQETFDFKNEKMTNLQIEGRHDQAIILRSLVVLESAVKIGLVDLYLRSKVYEN